MKAGRWCTGIGSVVLFVVGILHALKFTQLEGMIQASAIKPPLGGIAKGSWLIFSGEMMAMAVIALVGSGIPRGERIVLLCGLVMALNAVLLVKFVGVFAGVYITVFVMILFLAGAYLQSREAV